MSQMSKTELLQHERDLFEAEYTKYRLSEKPIREFTPDDISELFVKNSDGTYLYTRTQDCWEFWRRCACRLYTE